MADAGRPPIYSQTVADEICERIADGESLRSICREEGMPKKSTVFGWLADQAAAMDDFRTKYALAREAQADSYADDMTDIADNGVNDWMEKHHGDSVAWVENGEALRRSDLRIKTRQWIAEKLKPKKYGAKQEVNHGLTDGLAELMKVVDGKTRGIPGSG